MDILIILSILPVKYITSEVIISNGRNSIRKDTFC